MSLGQSRSNSGKSYGAPDVSIHFDLYSDPHDDEADILTGEILARILSGLTAQSCAFACSEDYCRE
jgi:hypothetical protein